jgi:threonine dehydratase
MSTPIPPLDAEVHHAAHRLQPHVVRTPTLTCRYADQLLGTRTYFKAECLQAGGSFKFRGAMNKLLQLAPQARRNIVAYSSGNHAVATAMAAVQLGCRATLVMPLDAPAIKTDRVRALGGVIQPYDRVADDRVAMCRALAEELAAPVVPSFDDPDIVCGQATAVLELIDDARMRGTELDAILVPCGGGGLLAGAVLAARVRESSARIIPVEPEGFADMHQSLLCGERRANHLRVGSICDALLVDQPGELTFRIVQGNVRSGLVVGDAQVKQAMRFAFRHLKLVLEPSGAAGLAALLSRAAELSGQAVGIVLSGGNVDPATFEAAIGGAVRSEEDNEIRQRALAV